MIDKKAALISTSLLILAVVVAHNVSSDRSPETNAACEDCNVLLISVEPLQKQHLSAYGYKRLTTPTISRLAEEGTKFKNAYTVSGHTLEATASTFTSLYPVQHGIDTVVAEERRTKPEIKRIAEVFQEEGYHTVGIDTRQTARSRSGLKNGFDYYGSLKNGAGNSVGRALEENSDEPFFMYLQSFAPHAPYSSNRVSEEKYSQYKWTSNYSEVLSERRDRWQRYRDSKNKTEMRELIQSDYTERFLNNESFKHQEIAAYDATVRSMDNQIKTALNELERRDRLDNTVIIFTSQHGESLGEHGLVGHSMLYEEVINVPLIISVPGIEQKASSEKYVSTLDLGPTLMDLAGIRDRTFEEQSIGKSFLPALNQELSLARNYLFATHFSSTAIIDTEKEIKYLRSHENEGIYNLSRDGSETEPLKDEDLKEYMRHLVSKYGNYTGGGGGTGIKPYYG